MKRDRAANFPLIPNRRIGKINWLPVDVLCVVQITILKHEKAHDKLVEINAMKILIRKANKLAFLNGRIALTLVSGKIVSANGGGNATDDSVHK